MSMIPGSGSKEFYDSIPKGEPVKNIYDDDSKTFASTLLFSIPATASIINCSLPLTMGRN